MSEYKQLTKEMLEDFLKEMSLESATDKKQPHLIMTGNLSPSDSAYFNEAMLKALAREVASETMLVDPARDDREGELIAGSDSISETVQMSAEEVAGKFGDNLPLSMVGLRWLNKGLEKQVDSLGFDFGKALRMMQSRHMICHKDWEDGVYIYLGKDGECILRMHPLHGEEPWVPGNRELLSSGWQEYPPA